MTLQDWADNRWIHDHRTTPAEIADLLSVVDRDIEDAALDRLSSDWRLGISYNAALQLANIALAAEGFRTGQQRGHERAIQSLKFTVGLDQGRIDLLDAVRRMRNISNYDRAGTTSETEAASVHELAVQLRTIVLEWVKKNHPRLL